MKSFLSTLLSGCMLTLTHFLRPSRANRLVGLHEMGNWSYRKAVTLRYPKEKLPVPEHGRYKLHNEINDCILCDKCARICPVNCIEIESIRSPKLLGRTSNGLPKRLHAARFDINLAKCCFCGLCTSVCPTECLTMTSSYDYSTPSIQDHTLSFAEMSPQEVRERRQDWKSHQSLSSSQDT